MPLSFDFYRTHGPDYSRSTHFIDKAVYPGEDELYLLLLGYLGFHEPMDLSTSRVRFAEEDLVKIRATGLLPEGDWIPLLFLPTIRRRKTDNIERRSLKTGKFPSTCPGAYDIFGSIIFGKGSDLWIFHVAEIFSHQLTLTTEFWAILFQWAHDMEYFWLKVSGFPAYTSRAKATIARMLLGIMKNFNPEKPLGQDNMGVLIRLTPRTNRGLNKAQDIAYQNLYFRNYIRSEMLRDKENNVENQKKAIEKVSAFTRSQLNEDVLMQWMMAECQKQGFSIVEEYIMAMSNASTGQKLKYMPEFLKVFGMTADQIHMREKYKKEANTGAAGSKNVTILSFAKLHPEQAKEIADQLSEGAKLSRENSIIVETKEIADKNPTNDQGATETPAQGQPPTPAGPTGPIAHAEDAYDEFMMTSRGDPDTLYQPKPRNEDFRK